MTQAGDMFGSDQAAARFFPALSCSFILLLSSICPFLHLLYTHYNLNNNSQTNDQNARNYRTPHLPCQPRLYR